MAAERRNGRRSSPSRGACRRGTRPACDRAVPASRWCWAARRGSRRGPPHGRRRLVLPFVDLVGRRQNRLNRPRRLNRPSQSHPGRARRDAAPSRAGSPRSQDGRPLWLKTTSSRKLEKNRAAMWLRHLCERCGLCAIMHADGGLFTICNWQMFKNGKWHKCHGARASSSLRCGKDFAR